MGSRRTDRRVKALLLAGALALAAHLAEAGDSKAGAMIKTVDEVAARGPFSPSWPSLERFEVPAWYQDGKFGIFIHWGLYSVPAFGNEWYPRNMYQQGSPEFAHHVATYGPQATFGYKDFIPGLSAAHFDAPEWARLFREAGARFVVPVAEHHDGFAMYDCSLTEWSAAKMGPKRDVLGELARAVPDEGLVFGLSSHRAEHWWFFDGGMTFDSDVEDPRFAGLAAGLGAVASSLIDGRLGCIGWACGAGSDGSAEGPIAVGGLGIVVVLPWSAHWQEGEAGGKNGPGRHDTDPQRSQRKAESSGITSHCCPPFCAGRPGRNRSSPIPGEA